MCEYYRTWIGLLGRQDLGRLTIEDIVELGDENNNEILLVVLVEPYFIQVSYHIVDM
jgi:hypothetical protein